MKILEIGCGGSPAVELGGSLFDSPVEYTGVDIDLPEYLRRDPSQRFIEADVIDMPFFEDASFDQVIVRNFFGQFCDGTVAPYIAERIIDGSIKEAHRVLRPLGQIAVIEENTPMDADDVLCELKRSGFKKIDHAAMAYGVDNMGTDNPWRQTRNRYFNDTPVQTAPDEWLGEPYVLTASKR